MPLQGRDCLTLFTMDPEAATAGIVLTYSSLEDACLRSTE